MPWERTHILDRHLQSWLQMHISKMEGQLQLESMLGTALEKEGFAVRAVFKWGFRELKKIWALQRNVVTDVER